MCGFVGACSWDPARPVVAPPTESLRRTRWRGPDGEGVVHGERFGGWFARLSIIDPSEEALQPLVLEGRTILFNGEVYNYKDLATGGADHISRRSDTWSLLHATKRLGIVDALEAVDGMYAAAFWDEDERVLHIARDRFGIKPLCWTLVPGGVLYGSDPAALAEWRTALGLAVDLDHFALAHYLTVGHVPTDATMWAEVHRVLPGEIIRFDGDSHRVVRRLLPADGRVAPGRTDADVLDVLRASVERHLIADVPVALFLSGGIDSSLVLALANEQLGGHARTFSCRMRGSGSDESAVAAEFAARWGAEHTTVEIGVEDFERLVGLSAEAYPEPFADAASLGLLALSERANQDAKVVLTGEGGDEMFGGYRRYWAYPLAQRVVRPTLGRYLPTLPATRNRRISQLTRSVGGSEAEGYLAFLNATPVGGFLDLLHPDLRAQGVCAAERFRLRSAGPRELMAFEREWHLPAQYLEKTDRATMRLGLEARVPFLDPHVAAIADALPQSELLSRRTTKVLLRRVAAAVVGDEVAARPKLGFGVPIEQWLVDPGVLAYVRNTLLDGRLTSGSLLDRGAIAAAVDRLPAEPVHGQAVYRLLALETWARRQPGIGL